MDASNAFKNAASKTPMTHPTPVAKKNHLIMFKTLFLCSLNIVYILLKKRTIFTLLAEFWVRARRAGRKAHYLLYYKKEIPRFFVLRALLARFQGVYSMDSFISSVITLALVMDGFGNIPLFIAALKKVSPERRKVVLFRELAIALVIMVAFLFLGKWFLKAFGSQEYSLSIAGGISLFII